MTVTAAPVAIAAMATTLAACALSGGGGNGSFSLDGEGARAHFAPLPSGVGEEAPRDALERKLLDSVAATARTAGQIPPAHDPRLSAVARILARHDPDGLPSLELQEFLLSHHGLGDAPPLLLRLRVDASDRSIWNRIVRDLPAALAGGPYGRVGVGVARRWPERSVIVALQRVDVELLPVPRQLPEGGSALLGGGLRYGLGQPRALVARPRGDVVELPVRSSADSFQSTVRCDDGPGRYQVEVVATGTAGKTLVANFPVFCGVAVPTSFPREARERAETNDPRQAETLMFAVVNQDRTRLGLARLDDDPALASVARAHSQDMAARDTVAHVSPLSGDLGSRARRGGIRALILMENVARGRSVAEAQRSFMTSPGHRANVVDRSARRLGVGIVIRADAGKAPVFYVTQIFAR